MCEKGIILIIVIFLLFPSEANTNDNYVVDGRIFGRMHSWPVQFQHSLEAHVWNIGWNYTLISWIRGGQVNREFSSSDKLPFPLEECFQTQYSLSWDYGLSFQRSASSATTGHGGQTCCQLCIRLEGSGAPPRWFIGQFWCTYRDLRAALYSSVHIGACYVKSR